MNVSTISRLGFQGRGEEDAVGRQAHHILRIRFCGEEGAVVSVGLAAASGTYRHSGRHWHRQDVCGQQAAVLRAWPKERTDEGAP